ncbi:twin-arginine translocation signal domain-containing protein [Candidatus Nanohalococcus occultus]|uniref:twin-arginine translocation signal domain-containing protein n=1 Tax=Candidatus Nanohalococcus occultus TaxID=2978047 RepID=UPI0039E1DC93
MSEKQLPDDIEEIIDRKVEERMKQEKQSDNLEADESSQQENEGISRRGFLKTLGLGAGALTFSSLVSGWSIIQPQNSGTSEIDADTVDGLHASEIGGGAYGDGSDGAMTNPSSVGGRVYPTNFTIESGNTTTLNHPYVFIFAAGKITINGTLDAAGASNNGGSGGAGRVNNTGLGGTNGGVGLYSNGNNNGGDGGSGGAGGNGGPVEPEYSGKQYDLQKHYPSTYYHRILFHDLNIGAGGGGGGGGGSDSDSSGGDGGDGGDGGGAVILAAPEIEVNGTIDASGQDGAGGAGGQFSRDTGGGGGGGGGNGGAITLITQTLIDNGTYDVSPGSGGPGGTGYDGGGDGQPGGDGTSSGSVVKIGN